MGELLSIFYDSRHYKPENIAVIFIAPKSESPIPMHSNIIFVSQVIYFVTVNHAVNNTHAHSNEKPLHVHLWRRQRRKTAVERRASGEN